MPNRLAKMIRNQQKNTQWSLLGTPLQDQTLLVLDESDQSGLTLSEQTHSNTGLHGTFRNII